MRSSFKVCSVGVKLNPDDAVKMTSLCGKLMLDFHARFYSLRANALQLLTVPLLTIPDCPEDPPEYVWNWKSAVHARDENHPGKSPDYS